MNPQLQAFVEEHVALLQKKYIFAQAQRSMAKVEADQAFVEGASFAYHDVLTLVRDQLEAAGYDLTALDLPLPERELEQEPELELKPEAEPVD